MFPVAGLEQSGWFPQMRCDCRFERPWNHDWVWL